MLFGQTYGDRPPIPQLHGASIPREYLRKNYRSLLSLYVMFFAMPLVIAWYYAVTVVSGYASKPHMHTAVAVRFPLLMLSVSVGAYMYTVAQGLIIFNYVTRDISARKNGAGGFKLLYTAALALAVVANVVHAVAWQNGVTSEPDAVKFTKYLAEKSDGSMFFSQWPSNLLVPLLMWFLLVEPCATAFLHTCMVLRELLQSMKG